MVVEGCSARTQFLQRADPGSPAGVCVSEGFSADGAHVSLLWQYGSVRLWNLDAVHRELAALGLDWTVGD